MNRILSSIHRQFQRLIDRWASPGDRAGDEDPAEIQCPVCGYYCSGNGGRGCIDKPFLYHKHYQKEE